MTRNMTAQTAAALGGALLSLGLLPACPAPGPSQTAKAAANKISKTAEAAFFKRHRIPQVQTTESPLSYIGKREGRFLATLAMRSRNIFEFGTGKGHTALLLAINSPKTAQVVTITLPPKTRTLAPAPGDSRVYTRVALDEVHKDRFAYEGTPVRHKVTQIFQDSKKLDETRHLARYDLIFVDGAHTYSFVKSDTQKALRMIRRGGVIVWHDYHPKRVDVVRYLNELSATLKLYHLQGTQSVVYYHP